MAYILQGEIKMAEGDLSGAINSFRASVEAEKTLGFSEPGPLPFSAHHWLGAALIEEWRLFLRQRQSIEMS